MTNETSRTEQIKLLNEKKQELLKNEEKRITTLNRDEAQRNLRMRMMKRRRRR